MMRSPSGVQRGHETHAPSVVRRTGWPTPSVRAFHTAPPAESDQDAKATQRPSGEKLGKYSRAVELVTRFGALNVIPSRVAVYTFPTAEKAIRFASGDSATVTSCVT